MPSNEVMTWIDPDGVQYPLTGQSDIDVLFDRAGFFMPPVSYDEVDVQIPTQQCSKETRTEGKKVQQITIEPRELRFSIIIKASDYGSLRKAVRKYIQAFNPLRGEGKLQVDSPDGTTRFIYCRYVDGMQGEETPDNTGGVFQKLKVILKAFDPYWYEPNTQVITFTQSQQATFFPFFPLRLTNASIFSDLTINNNGETVAFPVWKINGPGSNFQIENLTTGALISLSYTLQPGEYITIDTTPGKYKVEKNDGTPLTSYLSDTSYMWPLQMGTNQVRVQMDSADPAASSVVLSYQTKHLVV